MIVRLQGTLFYKQPPYLGIDVNGVGYGLQSSLTTFALLPDCGTNITLHTYLWVREDVQQLYGFFHIKEREMFLMLVKINGIGPKLALAILSTYDVAQVVLIVQQNDLASLTRISGVGKKTAERLLIELRDKIGQLKITSIVGAEGSLETYATEYTVPQEAVAALQALGYKLQEAQKIIQKIYQPGMTVEVAIRGALRSK